MFISYSIEAPKPALSNIQTTNLNTHASQAHSVNTPTLIQPPTPTSARPPANIIPTKKQVETVKVDELSWTSLLDEEDRDDKKKQQSSTSSGSSMDTSDDHSSSKWTIFQQHQKRQNELEEKMKLMREQKEEERRQQSLHASHFHMNERELAKRQREEERQHKMNDSELDPEAFEKEYLN